MKNRMIFKTAAAAAMALAFSGCAGITGEMGGERACGVRIWKTTLAYSRSGL